MSWLFPCGINTEEHGKDEAWPDCSLEAMNCTGLDAEEEREHHALHKHHQMGSSKNLPLERIASGSSFRSSAPSALLDKENTLNGTNQAPPAPGVPITVPGKYSLQEAIQIGQKNGNTIVISSGVHRLRQDVVIDGNIRIVGERETTIHGSFLCVEGSSGMLSGLKILAGGLQEGNGAVVISSGNWCLRDCVILGAGSGNDALQIGGDAKVVLQGCALGCNSTDTVENLGGAAMWVSGFATVKASECTMRGFERGVFVHGCSNVDFKFCTFSENSEAVVLRDRTVVSVRRCTFMSNTKSSFAVCEESQNLSTQRSTLIFSDNKFEKSPEWYSQVRPWKVVNAATEDSDGFLRAQSAAPMRTSSTEGNHWGVNSEHRKLYQGSFTQGSFPRSASSESSGFGGSQRQLRSVSSRSPSPRSVISSAGRGRFTRAATSAR